MRSRRGPASLEAVTIDAFGTLLELKDPVERLRAALASAGVDRDDAEVARAFAAEAAHYLKHSWEGRDAASLRSLRLECVAVFLRELESDLSSAGFVEPFVGSLVFRPLPGVAEALERLRGAGLRLACVSNWDYLLPDHLAEAGLADAFDAIVSSAEAGAPKPGARIFELALGRLGAKPSRALHVGDQEVDRLGAESAGLRFEPAPLVTLPERLGL